MKPFRLAAYLLLLPAICLAQTGLKTLTEQDFGKWEMLQGHQLSSRGAWLAYQINLVDGDGRLTVREVAGAKTYSIPVGSRCQFSSDEKWAAYFANQTQKEIEALRKAGKTPESKIVLRNLATGEEESFDSSNNFNFSRSGKYLFVQRNRGAAKTAGGSDLTIRNLADGSVLTLGNVTDVYHNPKSDLAILLVDSDSGTKGLQIFNPETSSLRNFDVSKNTVSGFTWAKSGDSFWYFSSTPDPKKDGDWNKIVFVTNFNSGNPTRQVFDPSKASGFPKDSRIVEFRQVQLSEDGKRIIFGTRPWKDKVPPSAEEKPAMDVWSWLDIIPMAQQKKQANFERTRSALCVWNIAENRATQITDEKMRSATVLIGQKYAIGTDATPYQRASTNGIDYSDVYLVSLIDGSREKIITKTNWGAQGSSGGGFITYYMGGQWWLFDISKRSAQCITKDMKTTFVNLDDDHTVPEKPPISGPQWFKDDAGFILNDQYDAYLFRPGNPPTRLTNGATEKIRYTLSQVNAGEDGLSISSPHIFRVFDTRLKKCGYQIGKATAKMEDANFTQMAKAKDADVFVCVRQSFTDSPNVYLCNADGSPSTKLTDTNPQQKEYTWGRTQLFQFKSKFGKELQGTLIYPADYRPDRQYPLVTYIYEKLSDNFNNYINPSNTNAYNSQWFSQNGYFVYLPDIAYRGNAPGISCVECLEPALDAVFKTGMIDRKKVGLMGHSWGGYQTTFTLSASKYFSVGVAGAPLTDMISMYLSTYWASGTPDAEIFESGQGRMGVPFYDDVKNYMANSAVFNAKNITAPMLVAQGTADGAVDWHQGQEMYQTLRRMGKNIVFLVYENEEHNFIKKVHQLDYTKRLRHWFDVYLKGAKPDDWIAKGVPFGGG